MLLALRSLWEAVSGPVRTPDEETSGGSSPAKFLFNLEEALQRSAIAYLRRAFARARAGDVTATGEAEAPLPTTPHSAFRIPHLQASGLRCLPSAQVTLRAPRNSLRLQAGAIATLPATPHSAFRIPHLNASGVLGLSEDELMLLMLAAA